MLPNVIRAVAVATCLGVGSSAMAATTAESEGGTNDTLFSAIYDFCINTRGTADDAARHVLRAPYQPRDMDAGRGTILDQLLLGGHGLGDVLYARHVGLLTLGSKPTLLVFRAASRGAPVVECRFNSVSQDIANMVDRLRAALSLPEAVNEEDSNDWHAIGRTSVQGRSIAVYLDYHQKENDKVGIFTLTAVGVNVNELLFQAMTAYCVRLNGTVDETARRATHAPFGAGVADPHEGAPYARSILLGMPGRGETRILLIGPSRSAPVSECRFTTSASDDLTDMITRLRTMLPLSEPTKDADGFWQMTGHSSANGRSVNVEVTYRFQENRVANFLHLHVSR